MGKERLNEMLELTAIQREYVETIIGKMREGAMLPTVEAQRKLGLRGCPFCPENFTMRFNCELECKWDSACGDFIAHYYTSNAETIEWLNQFLAFIERRAE